MALSGVMLRVIFIYLYGTVAVIAKQFGSPLGSMFLLKTPSLRTLLNRRIVAFKYL
jgi:hypothetical protein